MKKLLLLIHIIVIFVIIFVIICIILCSISLQHIDSQLEHWDNIIEEAER